MVLVGNPQPLPIRHPPLCDLQEAEKEVRRIEDILNKANVEVLATNSFRPNRSPPATGGLQGGGVHALGGGAATGGLRGPASDASPPATKRNVKTALEGAWYSLYLLY